MVALKFWKCRVFDWPTPIGRYSVRGTSVKLHCNLTKELIQGILRNAFNFNGRPKIIEMSRFPRPDQLGRDLVSGSSFDYLC